MLSLLRFERSQLRWFGHVTRISQENWRGFIFNVIIFVNLGLQEYRFSG